MHLSTLRKKKVMLLKCKRNEYNPLNGKTWKIECKIFKCIHKIYSSWNKNEKRMIFFCENIKM
jgi:hypothetical protein